MPKFIIIYVYTHIYALAPITLALTEIKKNRHRGLRQSAIIRESQGIKTLLMFLLWQIEESFDLEITLRKAAQNAVKQNV